MASCPPGHAWPHDAIAWAQTGACRRALGQAETPALDSAHAAANLLRLQVKLIKGEAVNLDQMLQQAQSGERCAKRGWDRRLRGGR